MKELGAFFIFIIIIVSFILLYGINCSLKKSEKEIIRAKKQRKDKHIFGLRMAGNTSLNKYMFIEVTDKEEMEGLIKNGMSTHLFRFCPDCGKELFTEEYLDDLKDYNHSNFIKDIKKSR